MTNMENPEDLPLKHAVSQEEFGSYSHTVFNVF